MTDAGEVSVVFCGWYVFRIEIDVRLSQIWKNDCNDEFTWAENNLNNDRFRRIRIKFYGNGKNSLKRCRYLRNLSYINEANIKKKAWNKKRDMLLIYIIKNKIAWYIETIWKESHKQKSIVLNRLNKGSKIAAIVFRCKKWERKGISNL